MFGRCMVRSHRGFIGEAESDRPLGNGEFPAGQGTDISVFDGKRSKRAERGEKMVTFWLPAKEE